MNRSGAALAVSGAAGLLLCLVATAVSAAPSGGWSGPEVVVPAAPAVSVRSASVAVDGRGAAVAAWTVLTKSGSTGALAERRTDGRSAAPRQLADPPGALAVNARGDAVLAWAERSPVRPPRIAVAYRRAGGGWQPRTLVSAKGDDAGSPEIAVNGRGAVLVTWSVRLETGEYRMEAAAHSPSGRWAPRRILATGRGGASPAMNQRGDTVVVWLQSCASVAPASLCAPGGPGNFVVRFAVRSARGVWTPPRTLSALGKDASAPQVAVNPSGTAIVLWQTYSPRAGAPPARGLTFAVGSTTGRFARPQPLFTGFPDGAADLALAPTGEAVAVWAAFDEVYAAARRPRGTFAAPARIGSGFGPVVGIDARGNATAVWTRSDDWKLFVRAARRAAGGAFDAGVDLAPAGADCTRHRGCNPEAELAVVANGSVVAIWQLDASPAQPFGDSVIQAAVYR